MIKNFTQVFDRLSAAGLKIKEVLNSCDQMRKYHLQILFGEVDAHLSGIIRNLKLSVNLRRMINSQSQRLLILVDLLGNANHMHGCMTMTLTCKF